MAFVPKRKADLFISYAHADNEPMLSVRWVSQLFNSLEAELNRDLGNRPPVAIWMDQQIDGSAPLTRQLTERIDDTALLLCVVSPAYLKSEWCKLEWQHYLQQRHRAGSRLFMVYMRNVRDNLPEGLRALDLPGYQFWATDRETKLDVVLGGPGDKEGERGLYHPLRRLTNDLAKELTALREAEGEQVVAPTASRRLSRELDGLTIFLAEVTDDLEEQRDLVRSFLEQHSAKVLPRQWYRQRDPEAYAAAVRDDLQQCDAFVQLLSATRGKRSDEMPLGIAGLQHDLAGQRRLRSFRWRSPEMKLDQIEADEWRRFIEAVDVDAFPIEEFKQGLVASLKPPPPAPPIVPPGPDGLAGLSVYVNSDRADKDVVEEICNCLTELNVIGAAPFWTDDRSSFIEDWTNQLTLCDGVIHVYGEGGPLWFRRQVAESAKVLLARQNPVREQALGDAPPPDKPDPQLRLPWQRIDCKNGVDRTALGNFVKRLRR